MKISYQTHKTDNFKIKWELQLQGDAHRQALRLYLDIKNYSFRNKCKVINMINRCTRKRVYY